MKQQFVRKHVVEGSHSVTKRWDVIKPVVVTSVKINKMYMLKTYWSFYLTMAGLVALAVFTAAAILEVF